MWSGVLLQTLSEIRLERVLSQSVLRVIAVCCILGWSNEYHEIVLNTVNSFDEFRSNARMLQC